MNYIEINLNYMNTYVNINDQTPVSLISKGLLDKLSRESFSFQLIDKICIENIAGTKQFVKHKINLKFSLGEQTFKHIFYVLDSIDPQFILGNDFMIKYNI